MNEPTYSCTNEQISTGCLQRIADATEKIAASYDNLCTDRDYWKRQAEAHKSDFERECRRVNALKGAITKLKKLKESSNG
jgi:hypothetical protein